MRSWKGILGPANEGKEFLEVEPRCFYSILVLKGQEKHAHSSFEASPFPNLSIHVTRCYCLQPMTTSYSQMEHRADYSESDFLQPIMNPYISVPCRTMQVHQVSSVLQDNRFKCPRVREVARRHHCQIVLSYSTITLTKHLIVLADDERYRSLKPHRWRDYRG